MFPTKQILSSKVAVVTSKGEALLNSGAVMICLNLGTQYCQILKVNSSCKDRLLREAREHFSSPAVFPVWVLDNILMYADKGHITSLMKSTDPNRGQLQFQMNRLSSSSFPGAGEKGHSLIFYCCWPRVCM